MSYPLKVQSLLSECLIKIFRECTSDDLEAYAKQQSDLLCITTSNNKKYWLNFKIIEIGEKK